MKADSKELYTYLEWAFKILNILSDWTSSNNVILLNLEAIVIQISEYG
jgi:hypothetical protein